MSQSPTTKSSSAQIQAYDRGWAAVNRLIRKGRSFSGREKNCCFLNTGSQRFANISAATRLDLPDDGRGLSVVDWDHDGRLDFWVTNRTGPRVRFLRNEYQTENDFVSLKLEGTKTNRDAAGARVRVRLVGDSPPLERSVAIGSGYLAQPSKRVHFGLGKDAKIQSVTVRWCGGAEESFHGVTPNGHFRLKEGTGEATRETFPSINKLADKATESPRPTRDEATSRVILLQPAPLPEQLDCTSSDGKTFTLHQLAQSQPLVLNFWSTTCAHCLRELEDWKQHGTDLEAAGLTVLALCVDPPSGDPQADLDHVNAFAKENKIAFPIGLGNQELIETLNAFQRGFIGRQSDLPLPSSLLIDGSGQLAAIYKGPVSAEQLIDDATLLGAPADQIMQYATPFPGSWLEAPPVTQPRAAAISLLEHGYVEQSEAYLRQLLPRFQPSEAVGEQVTDAENTRRQEYSSMQQFLAAIEYDKGNFKAAADHYQQSLDLFPTGPLALKEMYRTSMRLKDYERAAQCAQTLLQSQPDDSEWLANLAEARSQQGKIEDAIALFDQSLAIKVDPNAAFTAGKLCEQLGDHSRAIEFYQIAWTDFRALAAGNNLAWLLATSPDQSVRDGKQSVQVAREINEQTRRTIPEILSTLAAAQAESGDYPKAIETINEAIKLADSSDKPELSARLKSRLELFQNNKPYRMEPSPRPDPQDEEATSDNPVSADDPSE